MYAKAKELLARDYDKGAWEDFEKEAVEATSHPLGRLTANHVGRTMVATFRPVFEDIARRVACGEFKLSACKVVVSLREIFLHPIGHNNSPRHRDL